MISKTSFKRSDFVYADLTFAEFWVPLVDMHSLSRRDYKIRNEICPNRDRDSTGVTSAKIVRNLLSEFL